MDLTVVITSYNVEKEITRAIKCALDNNVDLEVLVIDDFSTDKTKEAVEAYNDKRVKFIQLDKKCGGPADSRTLGIQLAKGEFITFIDGDDVTIPHIYEKVVKQMRAINADVVQFDSLYIADDGVSIKRYPKKWNIVWNKLYRTSKIKNLKFYNCWNEDRLFIILVMNQCKIDTFNELGYIHFLAPTSLGSLQRNDPERKRNCRHKLKEMLEDYKITDKQALQYLEEFCEVIRYK